MVRIGLALSCEDHAPQDLVDLARRGEDAGFSFALASDHYLPWTHDQGHSPFVWCVLGAAAAATSSLVLGTAVTCPTVRMHPAVTAQAAATAAAMAPGRFVFGVGSGENLNEHVVGSAWPPTAVRHEMLEEAVTVMRRLFTGEQITHRGRHYAVHTARLFTRPPEPPPILVAAAGPRAARLAGRIGDGLVATTPDPDLVAAFDEAGGAGKPRYGGVKVAWAAEEAAGLRAAARRWPVLGLGGELGQELPTPAHFEQASAAVTAADLAGKLAAGPGPQPHIDAIRAYQQAGFDHVYVHNVGDDDGFLRLYQQEVLPALA